MRGAPLQTREAAEAARDELEDEARDREMLTSALDKVGRKYERLHPTWRAKQNEDVILKLTIGELRVLRQFGRKFHDA